MFSYAAVAIHNAKEMGGSTMFCYSYNSQTGVAMSQNTKFSSSILDQNDLTNTTVEIIDGNMKCSFTRPKLTNIQDIGYDLTDQYYLLLAEGLLQEGRGFSIRYFLEKYSLIGVVKKAIVFDLVYRRRHID